MTERPICFVCGSPKGIWPYHPVIHDKREVPVCGDCFGSEEIEIEWKPDGFNNYRINNLDQFRTQRILERLAE